MNVKIKQLHPAAKMPVYATPGSACFDLFAATVDNGNQYAIVTQGYPVVCETGLSFEIPEGWAMMVYSRSGHGFNFDTRLANCVGVIDSDYRGEVKVKLTCDDFGEDCMTLSVGPGDRVAQAMLIPIERAAFAFADDLGETERNGGFGSTGLGMFV